MTVGGGIFQPMTGVPIRRKPAESGWMQTIESVLLTFTVSRFSSSYYFMGVSIGGIVIRVFRKSKPEFSKM